MHNKIDFYEECFAIICIDAGMFLNKKKNSEFHWLHKNLIAASKNSEAFENYRVMVLELQSLGN